LVSEGQRVRVFIFLYFGVCIYWHWVNHTDGVWSNEVLITVLGDDRHMKDLILEFTLVKGFFLQRSSSVDSLSCFSEQLSRARTAATLGDSWVFSIRQTYAEISFSMVRKCHWFVKSLRSEGFIKLFGLVFHGGLRSLRLILILFEFCTRQLTWGLATCSLFLWTWLRIFNSDLKYRNCLLARSKVVFFRKFSCILGIPLFILKLFIRCTPLLCECRGRWHVKFIPINSSRRT
jgi:hypothetical protein